MCTGQSRGFTATPRPELSLVYCRDRAVAQPNYLAVLTESGCLSPPSREHDSPPVPLADCFTNDSSSPWQQPSICTHSGVVRLSITASFFFFGICFTSYKCEAIITRRGHTWHRAAAEPRKKQKKR